MVMYATPFFEGLMTGLALIVAIGAQNAFVLKQGIMRNHIFSIVLTCALIDALLIAIGVQGLGLIFTTSSLLILCAKWGGAAFLGYYGFRSFRAVFKTQSLEISHSHAKPSLKSTLLTVLALSLLNPHVYLDTVVLLGSIGAKFIGPHRNSFMLGAMCGSFIWFFSLGYGAKFLIPLFKKPLSWKILDGLIGVIMWTIAVSLILS